MKVIMWPSAGAKLIIRLKESDIDVLPTATDGTLEFTSEMVESIEIVPFFSLAKGQGSVLTGESINEDGKVLDRFVIQASGTQGKVTRQPFSVQSAVPLVDKQPTPARKPGGTTK